MPAIIATLRNQVAAAALRSGAPVAVSAPARAPAGAVIAVEATPPFQGFGWAYLQDSQYTQAAPLVIAAGQAQQITIDSLGTASDASYLKPPFAGWTFWQSNKFFPYSVGDDYELRLDFTAQSVAINNNVHAILSIGSAAGPVFDNVEPFGVGAGVQRNFRLPIDLFDKITFETNGATIMITPTAPMALWSAGLKISPRSVGTPR